MKMDEEMKLFMASVTTKLDTIPTKEQFEDFATGFKKNSDDSASNMSKIFAQDYKLVSMQASIGHVEREQVDA